MYEIVFTQISSVQKQIIVAQLVLNSNFSFVWLLTYTAIQRRSRQSLPRHLNKINLNCQRSHDFNHSSYQHWFICSYVALLMNYTMFLQSSTSTQLCLLSCFVLCATTLSHISVFCTKFLYIYNFYNFYNFYVVTFLKYLLIKIQKKQKMQKNITEN